MHQNFILQNEAEQEVWDVVSAFNRAFANNNPEEYFSYIDDHFTAIIPGCPYRIEGKKVDREEFEFNLKSGPGRVGYFQELQPSIQVFDNVALVTYHSRGSYGPDQQARTIYLKETDVLVKCKTDWKFVHIHVSAL